MENNGGHDDLNFDTNTNNGELISENLTGGNMMQVIPQESRQNLIDGLLTQLHEVIPTSQDDDNDDRENSNGTSLYEILDCAPRARKRLADLTSAITGDTELLLKFQDSALHHKLSDTVDEWAREESLESKDSKEIAKLTPGLPSDIASVVFSWSSANKAINEEANKNKSPSHTERLQRPINDTLYELALPGLRRIRRRYENKAKPEKPLGSRAGERDESQLPATNVFKVDPLGRFEAKPVRRQGTKKVREKKKGLVCSGSGIKRGQNSKRHIKNSKTVRQMLKTMKFSL
ncbi:LAMI_0G10660g1_1 [Lachancea mirantina]|uniref:LAMI_0G10660g1_1 n=1 Tax=Lachancea mirantina TaxID=1230905 RepID=A0A1G4KAS0_9SACH|nr:LAMI_0G10660g1_1 [Lachancea mirantina]